MDYYEFKGFKYTYRFKGLRDFFLSFLAVSICYIDRVNISVAIIPMQEQFINMV